MAFCLSKVGDEIFCLAKQNFSPTMEKFFVCKGWLEKEALDQYHHSHAFCIIIPKLSASFWTLSPHHHPHMISIDILLKMCKKVFCVQSEKGQIDRRTDQRPRKRMAQFFFFDYGVLSVKNPIRNFSPARQNFLPTAAKFFAWPGGFCIGFSPENFKMASIAAHWPERVAKGRDW